MKTKLSVVLFILIVLSTAAQPQRPRFGLEQFDSTEMLKQLSDKLELTDQQVELIEPILLQTQLKLNDLKAKKYDDQNLMMEEHRAMMDENAELIEEHLTSEQIEKFRQMREERPRFNKGDRPRMSRNRR